MFARENAQFRCVVGFEVAGFMAAIFQTSTGTIVSVSGSESKFSCKYFPYLPNQMGDR